MISQFSFKKVVTLALLTIVLAGFFLRDTAVEARDPERTSATSAADDMRDVLLVGNSVSGNVTFIDAQTFQNLGSVNVIPDYRRMMARIYWNPVRAIAYTVIKNRQLLHHFEPSDGDRFVDDVFASPDGTVLYVSRSNLGDVAAFDLTDRRHEQIWRSWVGGFKADHAAISPDGRRLVVSATTIDDAFVFDAATGRKVGEFDTGKYPHQNDYSPDGRFIYNSSIGDVGYQSIPFVDNDRKGDRWLVKADAETMEVLDIWEFDYGIRPNLITEDGRILYTQLSYLNGVIKYDLLERRELARSEQPLSDFAINTYANEDEYPHDSAHHGLSISGDGQRLCDVGTINNNVAIVRTSDMSVEHMVDVGMVPYWATTSPDGRHCFVSLSGDNSVAVIDFETGALVTEVPVGVFPQRSRLARVPNSVIENLTPP